MPPFTTQMLLETTDHPPYCLIYSRALWNQQTEIVCPLTRSQTIHRPQEPLGGPEQVQVESQERPDPGSPHIPAARTQPFPPPAARHLRCGRALPACQCSHSYGPI